MNRDFEHIIDKYGWYFGITLSLVGLSALVYILHHAVTGEHLYV